jgi:hypothetical protein
MEKLYHYFMNGKSLSLKRIVLWTVAFKCDTGAHVTWLTRRSSLQTMLPKPRPIRQHRLALNTNALAL